MAEHYDYIKDVILERLPRRITGPCSACAIDKLKDDTLLAVVTFGQEVLEGEKEEVYSDWISLCELHEGALLAVLLGNYLKRLRKNAARKRPGAGFIGALPKEKEGTGGTD